MLARKPPEGFVRAEPPEPVPPPPPVPAAGAPYSETEAETAIVRRTPHMSLSESGPLRPAQRFSIEVFADLAPARPGEETEEVALRGMPGQTEFTVEVWVSGSPHFEIDDPRVSSILIRRDEAESSRARFRARVKPDVTDAADATLCAYFSYNGRPSGRVVRRVDLALPQSAGVAVSSIAPPRTPADRLEVDATAARPDLTVAITDPTRSRRSLCCRVTTPLLPPNEQPPQEDWFLSEESGALVAQFMREFVAPGISPQQRVLRLKGAGYAFFDAAPKVFRDVLWKLIDAGAPLRSIFIASEEPFIPWELMIPRRRLPSGKLDEREPLGVQFAVGRWTNEQYLAPPQRVPLVDSYVVAPAYPGPRPKPLAHAAAEAQRVIETVPGESITPADLTTIDRRVAAARSLVHFVCHGADSPGVGIQVIYLNGGVETLSSLEVSALEGMIAAGEKKPLIFLNACEVGRPNVALVGIGGFAKSFVDLGASGVIAPLWSVRDSIAFDVADRFYTEIATKPARAFADILRDIRARAYDKTIGEDTYAAYCYYGDPLSARGGE